MSIRSSSWFNLPSIVQVTSQVSNVASTLSSTVMKNAQQWKQIVEENSFLNGFQRVQDKVLDETRVEQNEETKIFPWCGFVNEEEIKQQILTLSQDQRNFLRNPPAGADYHFEMSMMFPQALAMLDSDSHLKQMRFELVPRRVSEETFWRNYFYRVCLIQQTNQLKALTGQPESIDVQTRRTSDFTESPTENHCEFLSDDYDTSAISLEEIRREIEQLSNANKPDFDESEWDHTSADDLKNLSIEIQQILKGE